MTNTTTASDSVLGDPDRQDEHAYMNELLEAADDLNARGWPVIAADDKVPLGGQGWHNRRFSADEIGQLLQDRGQPQIGMGLGPDSFIDIEADNAEEERVFAKLFDGCDAPVTPTFRSKRGLHRLYRWDVRLEVTKSAFIYISGRGRAKLRIGIGAGGKAAQSIFPPSTGREWIPGLSIEECELGKLPDLVIERILTAANQSSKTKTSCANASSVSSNQGKQREGYKNNQKAKKADCNRAQTDTEDIYIAMCPLTLDEAINATIPSGPGHRHRQLFTFARYLKGIPKYKHCSAFDLKLIVRRWQAGALPFIATKDFEETWRDFVVAWDRIKYPIQAGRLAKIVQLALSKPLPEAANRYDDSDLKNLVSLCSELQQFHGDAPFYLGCREAARFLGGSATLRTRWNSYLKRLCDDKVLRLHSKGSRGKTSEYFYEGDTSHD